MTITVQFHGTQLETAALQNAIANNCGCEYGVMGVRTSTCRPHEMLVSDQRALDGLVFERRRFAIRFPEAGKRVIRATEAPHAQ